MNAAELVALVCCDLGSIVRGRSVPAAELGEHLRTGVGWVPANHAITPLGHVADPNPFGSTGDLRLLPDGATRVLVEADEDTGEEEGVRSDLDMVLCDLVELDGRPWECCPREFLRQSLSELEHDTGARVQASFEHEFVLLDAPAGGAFTLDAQRLVEPFPRLVMGALTKAGLSPQRFFAEYAPAQYEIPVGPANGLASADASVLLREIVREVARRRGMRASFVPLLDPAEAGNGVHIHLNLAGPDGEPLLYDPTRPGRLSELGGRFAAGVLAHARALTALTAPSPVSGERLRPHRWSAGAVCLAERNREALIRIPPVVEMGGADPAGQLHLEYRAADASANPYIALAAILRAGAHGIRDQLPPPPLLDRDPGELEATEAERFGVGALPATLGDSLEALADDELVRGWFPPLMYDAYTSIKRAELEAAEDVALEELCGRYAAIY